MLEKRFIETHEDEYPNKRLITKKEIDFLKQLQFNMNTQDHVCQADPRYWVIRDYDVIYGKDIYKCNGREIFFNNDTLVEDKEIGYDLDKLFELIKKRLIERDYISEEEANNQFTEEVITRILDYSCDCYELIDNINEEILGSSYFTNYDELLEICEYYLYPKDYSIFFSHQEAKDYLESHEYNFTKHAHTYALTTESSDINKLFKILHEVDFDSLIGE